MLCTEHFISAWQILTENQILKINNSNNLSFGHAVRSVMNFTFPCKVTLVNVSGPKYYFVLITHVSENVRVIISLYFHQIRLTCCNLVSSK